MSRVGLGLAHAHMLLPTQSTLLLQRALDLGITHFDTARLYSDGLSERTLGNFIHGMRQNVTITSKFGLLPTPLIGSLGAAGKPLRKVRSALNKLGISRYPKRSYTPQTLRKSLHASLRTLQTDYIDIYCIHEPQPDTVVGQDLLEELQRSKERGDVRFIGVSGAYIEPVVTAFRDSLDVIQTAEASWSGTDFVPDITHSLFSDNLRAAVAAQKNKDSIRLLLERALARRPDGAVVVQTGHVEHLEQIAAWAAGK